MGLCKLPLNLPIVSAGRYWANISDIVLTGEFRQWKEGTLTVNVYKPGKSDVVRCLCVFQGDTSGVCMPDVVRRASLQEC